MPRSSTALFALIMLTPAAAGQANPVQQAFAEPVAIERSEAVTRVPAGWRMDKLFIEATVEGETREFIFDTGSPTMISRAFAETLALDPIGQNVGVDANGNQVAMDVAVVETLSIGGTIFRDVPVLIFDFGQLAMARCLIDGGIIGSEILPGSAWRIDAGAEEIALAPSAEALGGGAPVLQARLYDFGYPHMPIVDYRLGDVADKALFDTGNAEEVILFQRVADTPSVRARIVPDSRVRGRGSEGESAGGLGEVRELERFTLEQIQIGETPFGPVRATTRSVPPSLVGAGLLDTHIVTLDYPGARFVLEPRPAAEPKAPEAGYAIAFTGEHVQVTQLFEGSPAAAAGLRLGDRVIEAQGRRLEPGTEDGLCETVHWLTTTFEPSRETELVVLRGGEPVRLTVPAAADAH